MVKQKRTGFGPETETTLRFKNCKGKEVLAKDIGKE